MRKLFVVGYEMCDVNVAVVLFDEDVLPYLISVAKSQSLSNIALACHTCR